MPKITGTRHYNVRVHQTWSLKVSAEELAAHPEWFEDGSPTPHLDQYLCDRGNLDHEGFEQVEEDDLDYDYEVEDEPAHCGAHNGTYVCILLPDHAGDHIARGQRDRLYRFADEYSELHRA